MNNCIVVLQDLCVLKWEGPVVQ